MAVGLLAGCGEPAQTCDATCAGLPQLSLQPDGRFGHIVCDEQGRGCVLDFGSVAVATPSESWTVLRNDGEATLHVAAFSVSGEGFEGQHPAVELEPGESVNFRITVRLDEAASQAAGQLVLRSDADKVDGAASGCGAGFERCGEHIVALRARTE